ncbi:MAG TPA: hypothetical protein VIY86_12425 [Pirellulaceae bacterium]
MIRGRYKSIWLRGNQRLLGLGQGTLLLSAIVMMSLMVLGTRLWPWPAWTALGVVFLATWGAIAYFNRRGVVTYNGQCLQLTPGRWKPVEIPLEVVECFFRGQGETALPDGPHAAETSQIVIRIADRAREWHTGPLPGIVGRWCGGYITLSGLWCEPITGVLLEQLNHDLVVAQRAARAPTGTNCPPTAEDRENGVVS